LALQWLAAFFFSFYDPVFGRKAANLFSYRRLFLIGLGLVNAALYNRFAYAHALMAEVGNTVLGEIRRGSVDRILGRAFVGLLGDEH